MTTITPAQQQNAVSALYIALFNRAPDAAGFTFWVDGLAGGASLTATINAFLASPEARDIYTTEQTSEQFVSAFYETVFGRAADAGGLVYWTDVLNRAAANDPETAKAVLVTLIIETVSTPLPVKPEGLSDELYAQTVADRDLFGKKVVAGMGYAIDEQGNDLDAAKKVIADLTAPTTPEPTPSPGPVTPPPPPPGETYVLTTGIDTLVGTNRNDIFDASLTDDDLQTLGYEASPFRTDTLDGGAGTDTLLATLNESLNGSGVFTPSLKNIEVIKVTALVGADNVFNLHTTKGVTHVGSEGSTTEFSFSGVGNAALSVSNQTADVAFFGSTATNLSLTLENVGSSGTLIEVALAHSSGSQAPTATTHDIVATNAYARLDSGTGTSTATTVKVAAEGHNQLTLAAAEAATVTNLTVTGKGSVNFSGQALSALTTFTAGDGGVTLTSDNTTAGSLTIKSGAGVDTITANAGSIKSLHAGGGNDIVTLKDTSLGSTATVDLGAGDDWLWLTELPSAGATIRGGEGQDILFVGKASLDAVAINAVQSVEVLALNDPGLTLDVSTITAMSSFMVARTGATTFTNARDTDMFEVAASDQSSVVTIANANGHAATDITLNNRSASGTGLTVGTLDLTDITTVSLTSSRSGDTGSNEITTLRHSDEATITVKGDTDLTFALSGVSKGSTVDATGFTGNLHVTGTAFTDVITGGDGNDIIQSGNFTTEIEASVTESAVVTWRDFLAASSGMQSIGGMSIAYNGGGVPPSSEEVAAAAHGEIVANLTVISEPTLWTVEAGTDPGTSIFTSKTPNTNVNNLAGSSAGSGTNPDAFITQGQAEVIATNGSVDVLTGGAGADTFVFDTPDADNTAGNITALITDFLPGTDKIQIGDGTGESVQLSALVRELTPFATQGELFTQANIALNGTVKYFLGELVETVDGQNVSSTYLVTDEDGVGYTNVIRLTGVALEDFQVADLTATVG